MRVGAGGRGSGGRGSGGSGNGGWPAQRVKDGAHDIIVLQMLHRADLSFILVKLSHTFERRRTVSMFTRAHTQFGGFSGSVRRLLLPVSGLGIETRNRNFKI